LSSDSAMKIASIAQLGERQTEDLKALCSIHSRGIFSVLLFLFLYSCIVNPSKNLQAIISKKLKFLRGEFLKVTTTSPTTTESVFLDNDYGQWD
jgi:hypothetical protein